MGKKIPILFFVLGTTQLLSCQSPPSLEELCGDQFPKFTSSIDTSFARLNGYAFPVTNDRLIATDEKTGLPKKQEKMAVIEKTVEPLNEDESDLWAGWARQNVKTLQTFMDILDERFDLRKIRSEINGLANEFSVFHGYAERGNSVRMAESLKSINIKSKDLLERTCGRKVEIVQDN